MKLVVGLGNPGAAYLMTRHNIGFMSTDTLAGSEAFVLKKNCKSLVVRKQTLILRPKSETEREQNKSVRNPSIKKPDLILRPKSETKGEQKKTGLRALFQKRNFSGEPKSAEPSKEIRFLIAKPQTYMNRSGEAAAALLAFYKIPLHKLLIIQDDVDQEFMKMKFQKNRGAGGHKGIQSVHDCLKTADYARLKLGVGRPPRRQAEPLRRLAQKEEESETPSPAAGASVSDYVLSPFSEREIPLLKPFLERAAEAVFCFLESGFEVAAGKYNKRL